MNAAVHSVWQDNFKAESDIVRSVARSARCVALNVQYPGCAVAEPRPYEQLTAEERYHLLKANVDVLRPIQVGLAIGTGDGEAFVFEFNLNGFDVGNPAHPRDDKSIAHLQARGVDFARLPHGGVDGYRLRWLLWDSGLIRRARPSWATFAGGYHVAYAVKMLTGRKLPASLDAFTQLVASIFGRRVYDVKRIAREHEPGHIGALTKLAERLGIAPAEQVNDVVAGASAALVLRAFELLRERVGESNVEKQCLQLSGLQAR